MKKRVFFLSAFTLGFFFGLGFMSLVQMNTLDRLYRIQSQLTNQLLDRDIKLEKLGASLEKQRVSIVKDLKIHINYEGNLLLKEEIEKNVRFYLVDLVGREIANIDGEMLYKILQNRIVEVEDKRVKLTVEYIIVNEVINIGITAKLQAQ